MKKKDLFKFIEDWAPKEIAWIKDNPGLQVGSPGTEIKNIYLSLDLTQDVLNGAVENNCNLIITHHPLLFIPINRLDFDNNENASLIKGLIQNNISLYSAHTNVDFTKGGISYLLADKLGLKNIVPLNLLKGMQYKLTVFVPDTHMGQVSKAIFDAGAGAIGDYSECSFQTKGTGTFKGNEDSNPTIGEPGKLEKVDEMKLEVIVEKWKLNSVINKLREAHPYEEVAYDLIPLANDHTEYGEGAIGVLDKDYTSEEFLNYISTKLEIKNFRYSGEMNKIKKVAVCGGSASELLSSALRVKADAFITADIKYHSFFNNLNKILLVDAGHFETERYFVDEMERRLSMFLKGSDIKVVKHPHSTNPIKYFNQEGV